jgi:hypothetical protein
MFSWGRKAQSSFDSTERLYWRFEDVAYREEPADPFQYLRSRLQSQFRLPDQSVNRSRYSGPLDVLFPSGFGEGVVSFCYSYARDSRVGKSGKESVWFDFVPQHVPITRNFGHSEVWIFRARIKDEHDKRPPKLVETAFKLALATDAEVVRYPDAAGRPPGVGAHLDSIRKLLGLPSKS